MAVSSNLITDKDIFVEYKYEVTEFYIITDGKEDQIPVERVCDFKIENFFSSAIFPIFKVNIVLEPTRYYNMIKNKDKVKFKVRIQKYYTKNGDSTEKSLLTDFINDTFIWFPNEADQNLERDLRFEEGKEKDWDQNSLEQITNNIELFLFKDNISNLRSKVNVIFEKVDLTTVITWLLSQGKVQHMLMTPLDNTTVYDEIVLPPLSVDKQLLYLNNNYGLHKKGTLIFFGLLHSYILSYSGTCTAYSKNEWTETVIYVLEKSNTFSHLAGSFIRNGEKRYYYNANPDVFEHSHGSVSDNVVSGTDSMIVDLKNNTSTTQNGDTVTVGQKNTNIIFNNTSNPYMGTTASIQQKANANTINLVLEHGNIEAFNPNKQISIIFEDAMYNSKFKGKYKVDTAIHNFTKNGPCYLCTSTLTLKKVE